MAQLVEEAVEVQLSAWQKQGIQGSSSVSKGTGVCLAGFMLGSVNNEW